MVVAGSVSYPAQSAWCIQILLFHGMQRNDLPGVLLNWTCVLSIYSCFSAPAVVSGSFPPAWILQLGKKVLGNCLPSGSIFVQVSVSCLCTDQYIILFSY